MKKFIKVADNGYSYINTDLIVRIDYTPREHRIEEYKNDPVNITMSNDEYHKISNEDAEELIKSILKTERERKMNEQRQEIIDTIIDIYNGKIKTYDEYLKIERDKTANAKTPYELFTEIISEETFNYIKNKRTEKENG